MSTLETWVFIAALIALIVLYRYGFGSPWPVIALIVGGFALFFLTVVIRL